METTGRTLQEMLETEYPLLDSSLIAAFISDLPSETDPSASFKSLQHTLSQLSLDAQTELDMPIPEAAALSSQGPDEQQVGSESSASVGNLSLSVSGASSASTTATSTASCTSALEFLHILFPHLSEENLKYALQECCDPQDPDGLDLSATVDNLLTLEYIQDLVERGLEDEEAEPGEWLPVVAQGKRGTASRKRKSRAHTYRFPLTDIMQRQRVLPAPVSDSMPASSSFAADPWTHLISLSTRLSELLQPTTPGFFMSYFHSPVVQASNHRTGWKSEGDGLRNALSDLADRTAVPIDEKTLDVVRKVVLDPGDKGIALLSAEQLAELEADTRLCVMAAKGDCSTAIDLFWLLRDLDAAFPRGEGVAHAVKGGAVPSQSSRVTAFSWTASPHAKFTLPTQPPPVPPPPPSQKHPPSLPSARTDDGWTLVRPQRHARGSAHPHAEFIPAYSNRNHARKNMKGAGNQFGKGGKSDVGELQVRSIAWYKAHVGEIQTQRNEALREATRHWKGGNVRSRGGEVAMYYAEKARDLQEQQKQCTLEAARAMVEEKRTTNGELDLHGLTVAEACVIVTESLTVAPPAPDRPVMIITGRGRHSAGNVSVLGPAVREMLRSAGWRVGVWDGGLVVRGRMTGCA